MSNAVATKGPTPALTAVRGETPWEVMHQQATVLVKSGFLPDAVKTAEQAIAIMLTGEELGIPKMLALRSISVIKGKPSLSADLMAALIHREIDRHGDGLFDVQPPTAEGCTVKCRHWGREQTKTVTYTMQDAATAGMSGNDMYKRHPKAMLKARAITSAARLEFPDVIAGLYAPEEFDGDDAPPLRVVEIAHGLDVNADNLPERQLEVVEAEAIDVGTGEIETLQSVKQSIQALVKFAEYSDEDLKHVAVDLGIERGWRELTLEDAVAIRNDIHRRMDAEDAARAVTDDDREALPLEKD